MQLASQSQFSSYKKNTAHNQHTILAQARGKIIVIMISKVTTRPGVWAQKSGIEGLSSGIKAGGSGVMG